MGVEILVGAVLSGISVSTTSVLYGLTISFSWMQAAVGLVLGALSSVMTPKPPKSNFGGGQVDTQGITRNARQPITVRQHVYGEVRVGGDLCVLETSSSDRYLHMVIPLADHEIQEIGEVWFDDVSIPEDYIDGSGNVIDGPYSGKARIKKYLGTSSQTADSDLIAETSFDSNARGRGVAYIYVRLDYDRDVYPSKIPTVTAFVRGKKLYDPRDGGTRYSANIMLMVNDYLVSPVDALATGAGASQSDIDTTTASAAANVCDEIEDTANLDDTIESADSATDIITLTGVNDRLQYQTGDRVQLIGASLPTGLATGTDYYVIAYQRKDTVRIKLATSLANAFAGTAVSISATGTGTIRKTGEPRYHGGGVITTSTDPQDALTNLLSGCGGSLVYLGGKYTLFAAAYNSPTVTFTDDHIIGPIRTKTKISRRDRFNLVKGKYISPINDGQPSDYPSVTNATYVSNNQGVTLPIDHDLPMTQRPHTAQRLAKIRLEKQHQEITFEAEFSLHAMQVQPADVVYITNSSKSWSSKEFEVMSWSLASKSIDGVPLYYIKMTLRETASTVYDWNSGEETAVDPAPNTNLPNSLSVNPVTGIGVTPIEVPTAEGDLTYEFLIGWTPPSDIFVVNGGHYDVIFKKSSESTWNRSFRAEDEDTSILVKQVQGGVNYDVGIRAVNNLGVRSEFSYLYGFTVDSPSGATIKIDYGAITGTVAEVVDYGAITGSNDATNDLGAIT